MFLLSAALQECVTGSKLTEDAHATQDWEPPRGWQCLHGLKSQWTSRYLKFQYSRFVGKQKSIHEQCSKLCLFTCFTLLVHTQQGEKEPICVMMLCHRVRSGSLPSRRSARVLKDVFLRARRCVRSLSNMQADIHGSVRAHVWRLRPTWPHYSSRGYRSLRVSLARRVECVIHKFSAYKMHRVT